MVAVTVVDSNVWIFSSLKEAPEHAAALAKLEQHRNDGLQLNAIIVSETFHRLSRLVGAIQSAAHMKRFLASRFVVYEPLTFETAKVAIEISLDKQIRINDAMIAAHALETRQPVLTDNEKDFKKIRGLKVIPLRRVK